MQNHTKVFFASVALGGLFLVGMPALGTPAWEPDLKGIAAGGFSPDYTTGNELLYVREEGGSAVSAIRATNPISNSIEVCADIGAKFDCGTPGAKYVAGSALLPVCTDAVESCIEKLEISIGDEDFRPATYKGTTNGTKFVGNPGIGIPNGSGPAIFESDQLNSAGSSEYTVKASLDFSYDGVNRTSDRVRANEFSVRIYGTRAAIEPGTRQASASILETPDGKGMNFGIDERQDCVYQDTDLCGKEVEFAASTSFRVTVVLSNEVTGWFRGRLQKPEISIEAVNSEYSRVAVSGTAVEVPRFLATFSLAKGDPDIVGTLNQNAHGGQFTLFEAASERGMEIVNGMRDRVKDTAAGVSSIWSINSISGDRASGGSYQAQTCLQSTSKVLGLVTTNAMTYTGTVPDYSSGYLSYKVAGLHYQPDGKALNIGTYDLVLRSDTARCLYGFSKAPISATVAVIGDLGTETVATTIVSEKDGWLRLSAYGFTFSEKEIQMQLTQPQTKSIGKFATTAKTLNISMKTQVRSFVAKSKGNKQITCTGYFAKAKDRTVALERAKATCVYAKSLDKNPTYLAQAKQTTAAKSDSKVMLISK